MCNGGGRRGSETLCPVCLDHIVSPTVVRCGHTFCENCIAAWLQADETCPMCREVCDTPTQSRLLDSLLRERLMQTLPAKEFSGWEDRCREFVRLKQEAQREHAARRKRARRLVEFVLESIS